METFIARYRNITILALAIFGQLLLLGYQLKSDRDVRLIRLWGVTAITPVARVVHGGQDYLSGLWSNYVWLYGARRQNERLRGEVDRLKLENQSLRSALGTAAGLQALAAYQHDIASETTPAEVIGTGANPNSRVVFLNKGGGSGVQPGMAVITPDGIVGKVEDVFPGSSLVLLISDNSSAAGVVLENSHAHGVLKGTGLNEARIDYIPNEEKVSIGEKVYTSGEDRIYPKGLVVGTVTKFATGRDFQDITVQPGAKLDRLEEVLIVTKGVHQELPSKLPRAQAPAALLPPPRSEERGDLLGLPRPAAAAAPAGAATVAPPGASPAPASQAAQGYQPQTDADRLKERYRELGTMEGHTFGAGAPGSKPPDFNRGWRAPGQRPSGATASPPAGPPGTGPASAAGKARAPEPEVQEFTGESPAAKPERPINAAPKRPSREGSAVGAPVRPGQPGGPAPKKAVTPAPPGSVPAPPAQP
ncbi:MAG TPA: rod shape-determining protein MreC [Bryobacterales bacterium]|nr:rod shape-determining protein MreC [Bryobacterales bacterium]